MNYYTSDIHFGQKSLLRTGRYRERPFDTLDEMQKEIIKRWNAKVTNADHVYILGDVGARGFNNMHAEILAMLKGNKHLILGNHDDVSDLRVKQQFVEICESKRLSDSWEGQSYNVLLTHEPYMMWAGQHSGTIMLYGHLHNTREEMLFQKYLREFNIDRIPDRKANEPEAKAYNVGMCLWEYEPVTLKEILNRHEVLSDMHYCENKKSARKEK